MLANELTYWRSVHQGTLDGTITQQPRIPPFSTSGFLDYVVELVVSEDDVRITNLSFRAARRIADHFTGYSTSRQGSISSSSHLPSPLSA